MSARKRGASNRDSGEPARSTPSRESSKAPLIGKKRLVTRTVLPLLLIGVLYISAVWKSRKVTVFAGREETLALKSETVPCSNDYATERKLFTDCAPKTCGRAVSDDVVTAAEVQALMGIAKRGLSVSRSEGGASILDLHSGLLEEKGIILFTDQDLKLYRTVKNKIRSMISFQYGVPPERLYLTHPTFFSEMTSQPAKTVHDEYWHVHVDKETYGSFHYTSLLYLSNYGSDFGGGRLVFVDQASGNRTVEPRKGRVLAFTSGSENPHYVEKVDRGVRYALTVSFTCDPSKAIGDPGSSQKPRKAPTTADGEL